MTKTEVYKGTKGLTIEIALSRMYELMDKQPLGGKDKEFYVESKQVIDNDIKVLLKEAKAFLSVKDSLSNKQWNKVFYGDEE
jgi:hypothetical protein